MLRIFFLICMMLNFSHICPEELREDDDEIVMLPKAAEDSSESNSLIDLVGMPNSMVGGCVNAVTGNLCESHVDLVVPGSNPLTLARSFNSGIWIPSSLCDIWNFNLTGEAYILTGKEGRQAIVRHGGGGYNFKKNRNRLSFIYPQEQLKYGVTNCYSGYLSAKNNIKNIQFQNKKDARHCYMDLSANESLVFYTSQTHREDKALYFLEKHYFSNRCLYDYDYYKHSRLDYIYSKGSNDTTLGHLHFIYPKKFYNNPGLTVQSSDGRSVFYKFEKMKIRNSKLEYFYFLSEVISDHLPHQLYEYSYEGKTRPQRLIKCSFPDGRYKKIEYYKKGHNQVCGQDINIKEEKDGRFGAISALLAPVGTYTTPIHVYQFIYHLKKNKAIAKPLGGSTEVIDANNNKVVYHYSNEHRLNSIEHFLRDGSIYRTESMFWGKKDSQDYTQLIKRSISNKEGKEILSRDYSYDSRGNVIREIVVGDLSGLGKNDTFTKTYSYTSEDQIETENDEFKQFKYSYYPKTDLLKQKLLITGSIIRERYFYDYDSNGSIILEIMDDGDQVNMNNFHGVTQRYIKQIHPTTSYPIGLPEVIDEKYLDLARSSEVLIRRTVNSYSREGKITKQVIFDANLHHAHTLEWGYNAKGDLSFEVDALGQTTSYQYDENKNCTLKQGPDLSYHTLYSYDYSNRLIREEEVHSDGHRYTKSYTYDYCGNKINSTDIFGNTINYIYDEFNRLIEITHPPVVGQDNTLLIASEKIGFDILNNVTSKIDSNGNITNTTYSALCKPICIQHPDGSLEKNIYRTDGMLIKSIFPNDSYLEFSYDYKNRKIGEKHFSSSGDCLTQRYWTYSAFQLLSEVDKKGIVTQYFYDSSGKLIKTIKDDEETHYDYDARGRKIVTWEKSHGDVFRKAISVYDNLDRVLEERMEDNLGNLYSHKAYAYDVVGNRTRSSVYTSSGIVTKLIEYDSRKQPIKIVEPSGDTTHILRNYDFTNIIGQTVLHEEEIDPIGTITSNTYDTMGRVALQEIKSPCGVLLRRSYYRYDDVGNLIRKYENQIVEGCTEKTIQTSFEYDCRDREISIYEAYLTPEQKITRREYNSIGKISRTIKPDGVSIDYNYDLFGRLVDVNDSNGTIHYQYTYDKNNNILSVLDVLRGEYTTRKYDPNNRLTTEILGNGIILEYVYDSLGRIIQMNLPDQSNIIYKYNVKNLSQISRVHRNSEYILNYRYDLSGKLVNISLPNNKGAISYSFDNSLRLSSIHSPYYTQLIPEGGYDPCNQLLQFDHSDNLGTVSHRFNYDFLHQLVTEDGAESHTYTYDSRFNRIQKDDAFCETNSLNQLLSQGSISCNYDANGNRQNIDYEGQKSYYEYDSLERLVSVKKGEIQIKYEYDAFNRRMKKSVLNIKECESEPCYSEKYLYVMEDEIGTMDQEGKISELKILGPGSLQMSAIIDIDSEVYIPIHDHRGNIMTLFHVDTGAIFETYRYSAYGEEQIYNSNRERILASKNPWRFSGKRVDEETGLNYFGHRYYDSKVGRWITADPLWFEDGPNLYAYVHNSPIQYVDPNGLYHLGFVDNFECLKAPTFNHFEKFADFGNNCCRFMGGKYPVYSRTEVIPISGNEHSKFTMTMTNGIWNSRDEAINSAEMVSKMAGGCKVILVYNGSHGPFDFVESALGMIGVKTEPSLALDQVWNDSFKKMGEGGKILHVGHSQGCINSFNSLKTTDSQQSKNISMIGVAPARFVDKDMCGNINHIGSQGDIVSRFDFTGRLRNADNYIELTPHPEAKMIDHEFASPTFGERLETTIRSEMRSFGVKI
jgi:RHS repeat-associated protein